MTVPPLQLLPCSLGPRAQSCEPLPACCLLAQPLLACYRPAVQQGLQHWLRGQSHYLLQHLHHRGETC